MASTGHHHMQMVCRPELWLAVASVIRSDFNRSDFNAEARRSRRFAEFLKSRPAATGCIPFWQGGGAPPRHRMSGQRSPTILANLCAPWRSPQCYLMTSFLSEKIFYHGWTRMNPTRLTPQPQILDCGGNPAEREPRRFWKQPAARKAVSPLRSGLRCASPRQAATAVQIFVVRARNYRIVLRMGKRGA